MVELDFPPHAKDRGSLYWLRPGNLWASRRKFKSDYSNEWRYVLEQRNLPAPARSMRFDQVLGRPTSQPFRILILGDTGEGDHSQYGLLPLIQAAHQAFAGRGCSSIRRRLECNRPARHASRRRVRPARISRYGDARRHYR